MAGFVELARLGLELCDEIAGKADGADHPLAHAILVTYALVS